MDNDESPVIGALEIEFPNRLLTPINVVVDTVLVIIQPILIALAFPVVGFLLAFSNVFAPPRIDVKIMIIMSFVSLGLTFFAFRYPKPWAKRKWSDLFLIGKLKSMLADRENVVLDGSDIEDYWFEEIVFGERYGIPKVSTDGVGFCKVDVDRELLIYEGDRKRLLVPFEAIERRWVHKMDN